MSEQAKAVNAKLRDLGVLPSSEEEGFVSERFEPGEAEPAEVASEDAELEHGDSLANDPEQDIEADAQPSTRTPKKGTRGRKKEDSGDNNNTPPEFDPVPIVEGRNLWWLNGGDKYYQVRPDSSSVLRLTREDVKCELRIAGCLSRASHGKAYSQMDVVMQHIRRHRHVDYAGPLAGKRIGVYDIKGKRVLVTTSYKLIEPEPGDWPTLRAVFNGLLQTAEADQTRLLYAWLKVAIEALRNGYPRPGHALILAGPSDCGKSFIQEHVISPLLGGRPPANPMNYLLGKTTFNAEMVGTEHLAIQEVPSGIDHKSRALFSEELKRLVATESHALHPKYCDAITVYPWWRVSISINDTVDKIKALPPLSSDFGDKVLLLKCISRPMPMPTVTDEERAAFRAALESEMPAFVNFLLLWEIPEDLRRTKHASRFGFDHFHHPELTALLFEQEPQASLLYVLDNCKELYAGGSWGWASAEELRETLSAHETFGHQVRKLFSFAGACGTYLSKLREKFPQRLRSKHTSKGNLWLIAPPEAQEAQG